MANQEKGKVTVQDFTYVHGLDEGAFGRVVLVRSHGEGKERLIALRQQKKSSSSKKVQRTEQKILECARKAPFCARLLASFQTTDYDYLLTAYYSKGSLQDHINLKTQFTGQQLTLLAAEMCEALLYLHKNYIIYRNMKPDNIVFDARGHCKLNNFGCAIFNYTEHTREDRDGTPSFWGPELFEIAPTYNKMVDWWALGVTLLTVVMSYNPLDAECDDYDEYLEGIEENVTNFDLAETASAFQCGSFSLPLKRFIGDLLQKDPVKRLGATEEQIRAHSLFRVNNLLLDLYQWRLLRRRQMPPPLVMAPGKDGASPAFVISQKAEVQIWHDEDMEKDEEKYDRKVTPEEFTYMRGLGEGSFGRVVLVKSREEGSQRLMALKQQRKTISLKKRILLEQKILQRARKAPFCARLLASFQTADYAYLLTDYYSQESLQDHVNLKTQFTGQQLTLLAAEMCEALLYLHKKYIIHGDVKPQNIMFDGRGHCRLIDFGCAFFNHRDYTYAAPCGTVAYWAPELFKKPAQYNKMVDWWALGVTLLTVVVTYNPMEVEGEDWDVCHEEVEQKVANSEVEETASAFQFGRFPLPLKTFIGDLLQKDPTNRLGTTKKQIRSHSLFTDSNLLLGPDKWQLLRTGQMPPPLAVAPVAEREEGAASSAAAAAAVSQRGESIQLWQDNSSNSDGANVYKDFDACYFSVTDETSKLCARTYADHLLHTLEQIPPFERVCR